MFWQDYLSDFQNRTRLDIEKHRTSTHQLGRFAEASCLVQARDFSALETLCKSLRITPNIAIQAAWSILISRYSNTDDVVWGTTVSGRPAELTGVEKTVGLFINTIPLRAKINWEQSTTEFLRAMQRNQIAVMEFENTSLRDITRWSELPNGEPLFQSVVVYENYPSKPNDQGDTQDPAALWFSDIEYKEQSDLPLALIAIPEQGLKLILIYDQSVFEPDQIQRILEQMKCLLSNLPYHANAPLNTVPFLPWEETDTLLYKWNQTQCELESENFIDQLILKQAKSQPDATALVCGQDQLSYGQMERRSLMLLEHLTSRTIGPGDIIGICLPRGVDALVWMLAVLRSGAAYLMLDPDYPSARLRDMLERSGASLVISDLKNSSRFRPLECLIVLDDGSAANETDLGQKQNRERNSSDRIFTRNHRLHFCCCHRFHSTVPWREYTGP
ncbi:MAG: condensation domain-containing protein [Gammaproteobacteria bacterium]